MVSLAENYHKFTEKLKQILTNARHGVAHLPLLVDMKGVEDEFITS
jgi:hypothetical protein